MSPYAQKPCKLSYSFNILGIIFSHSSTVVMLYNSLISITTSVPGLITTLSSFISITGLEYKIIKIVSIFSIIIPLYEICPCLYSLLHTHSHRCMSRCFGRHLFSLLRIYICVHACNVDSIIWLDSNPQRTQYSTIWSTHRI